LFPFNFVFSRGAGGGAPLELQGGKEDYCPPLCTPLPSELNSGTGEQMRKLLSKSLGRRGFYV